ncbi:MAG: TrkH family potassium uptake protein [Melioribacteraceae bacterium]|nr:TrkH family potassium uptake protein [Melioribacteraceae bacterium]MCF8356124.1 TrkH family potassium uptake protein [Melioribacteraceae bacterium]MCF8395906.1 TrkH family potassium uptake protein [Melioribacteraceae bacterium]MCF8420987.1 TrkH family potassium uptake protein [Melioribacteraceae bacterium]
MKIISYFFRENILHKLSSQSILLLGFIGVIIIGSVLLYQPFSISSGSITFVDALFTSASATCVTGLIVVDTGTYFTTSGQVIILSLIQIGGLGVMSFSTLFLFFLRGKIGIGGRELIHETLTYFDTIDIGALLKSVFVFTFLFEGVGTILLTARFMFDMPFNQAIYNAIFHSISAFCNAGFSTFSDSLIGYRSDIYVNLVMAALIFSGGIGFVVIYELYFIFKKGMKLHKLSLHSKVVLSFSIFLIVIGAILLFTFEFSVSMKEFTFTDRIVSAIFQSVTARTAGFNTIDIYSFSMSSIFVIVTLMFIGASPASCGGGVKTATIAVIIAFIKSKIRDTKNVNLFYNTLPFNIISKAIVIIVFGVSTVVLFSFLISAIEMDNSSFSNNGGYFIQIFFEVVSAFGTVGLSTGITSDLSSVSRILFVLLMLIGRVGPLTLAVAVGSKENVDIKYAEDNILVG